MKARTVLHISGDFPDPVDAGKTKVIAALLDMTDAQFPHRVISLNRAALGPGPLLRDLAGSLLRPSCRTAWQPFARGEAVSYAAPGKGLFHATYLKNLAQQIAARLGDAPPALIVGHKLTIEGIVAAEVAARIGRPYALTIQGDTDTKILGARPDLKPLFARIFHEAAHVFCFAPWALARFEHALGKRTRPVTVLPCPTELDQPVAPVARGSRELISVFHLQSHRRKNLQGMVAAAAIVEVQGTPARLAIYGGGNTGDLAAAGKIIGTCGSVRLAGPAGRDRLPALMNGATGFVLPSLRETFGLVFVEALFAGLPIIYPEGQAVSGYLDDLPFAIPVASGDTRAIAAAMATLVEHETALKAALAEWQASEDARRFQRPAIAASFAAGLGLAVR